MLNELVLSSMKVFIILNTVIDLNFDFYTNKYDFFRKFLFHSLLHSDSYLVALSKNLF